ncbi:hypothetical protein ACFV2U_40125 [Streptomyces sp. NPDC059697]|uniref:hypothetical protein n=1 Tax=Streptomyces sp. NPDC059697 TaxID=3346912 RepID=UPI00367754C5
MTKLQSCGHGGVTNNHTWVWACDDQSDGQGYGVHYWLRNGTNGWVTDNNGHKGGCGNRHVGTPSNPVVKLQSCDKSASVCSPTKKA